MDKIAYFGQIVYASARLNKYGEKCTPTKAHFEKALGRTPLHGKFETIVYTQSKSALVCVFYLFFSEKINKPTAAARCPG